ncbi:MAG: hypothetical protein R3321_01115 [Nitrososphaeraceae archaeon]|nr:hypothetical protein [Nitrososphaeraceae archaeon]
MDEPVFSSIVIELIQSIEKLFEDKNDEIRISLNGDMVVKQK